MEMEGKERRDEKERGGKERGEKERLERREKVLGQRKGPQEERGWGGRTEGCMYRGARSSATLRASGVRLRWR